MSDAADDLRGWKLVYDLGADLDLGVDSSSALPGDVRFYTVELQPATDDGPTACRGHDHLLLWGRRVRQAYGAKYRGTERTVKIEVSVGALVSHLRECGHDVEVAPDLEEATRPCLALHEVEFESVENQIRFTGTVHEEPYVPREERFHVPYGVLAALLRRRGHRVRTTSRTVGEGDAAAVGDPWVPADRQRAGACPECGVAPRKGFPSFDHAVGCSRRR